jgi:hypothetical protein
VIVLIAVGIGVIVSNLKGQGPPGYAHYAFYSDDDGASYFEDSNQLVPPFDHGGKLAYRAHVFTYDGGKTKWVGYLEGYTSEARPRIVKIHALMDKLAKDPHAKPPPPDQDPMYVIPEISHKGLVIKQPGKDNKWVSEADGGAFAKAKQVVCPDGVKRDLEEVLP